MPSHSHDGRLGLAQGDFKPWFQPIVSLSDGALFGYEALVRWSHEGTYELPGAFLPVAQRSDLITEIDLAMVEPVVSRLARLDKSLSVALNVTGATLARIQYADAIAHALRKHNVEPSRLHLEITETLLLSLDETVTEQMQRVADLGCRWYVDDFGTGYSSISHLRDLPVAGLKLDRSFTTGVAAGDETSRQLAMGLLGLANGLGLDTVVAGVETETGATYLRAMGWQHGQGWLWGRPAPLE